MDNACASTSSPVAPVDDERTRRKPLAWWDRVKFLVLLAALFGFMVVGRDRATTRSCPVSEAVNNVARSRWWIFVLGGLELVRQIHFVIANTGRATTASGSVASRALDKARLPDQPVDPLPAGSAHQVVGHPRRVQRARRVAPNVPEQLADLPSRTSTSCSAACQDMPMILVVLLFDLTIGVGGIVILFWYMSRGGSRGLLPRRRQDPFRRRVGSGRRPGEDPGEPDLPGEPGGDRGEGRVRPRGHPALRATGHRQDPHGRGRRRRDRQALRVRRAGRRSTNMFFGVGVLKVRSLFKKLRKLALRYGGVDRRSSTRPTRWAAGGSWPVCRARVRRRGPSSSHATCCNGTTYLSDATARRCSTRTPAGRGLAGEPAGPGASSCGGMGRGGDPMALQALLAELSGLKKPRGFLNRPSAVCSGCGPSRRPSTASS